MQPSEMAVAFCSHIVETDRNGPATSLSGTHELANFAIGAFIAVRKCNAPPYVANIFYICIVRQLADILDESALASFSLRNLEVSHCVRVLVQFIASFGIPCIRTDIITGAGYCFLRKRFSRTSEQKRPALFRVNKQVTLYLINY